jgi:hypothetical protein
MTADKPSCGWSEDVMVHYLGALPAEQMPATEAHIAGCADCQQELESLQRLTDRFIAWPTDLLRPSPSLQRRLAERIAGGSGAATLPPPRRWSEPEWEQVAAGIECKLLANDAERHRISMLVRLAPGASYPPHAHAEFEELHLLAGELWIDARPLMPGDYYYGAPGTGDSRVWSETGCTCLLITSTKDILR